VGWPVAGDREEQGRKNGQQVSRETFCEEQGKSGAPTKKSKGNEAMDMSNGGGNLVMDL